MYKSILLFVIFVFFSVWLFAQNVGIGTTEPANKLQVQGNFVVTSPVIISTTEPTPAQTKNMINGSNIGLNIYDSVGRIYDPGGPTGNYSPNQTANFSLSASSFTSGVELTIESIDLSSADSLIIKDNITGNVLMAVGNIYTSSGKWIFNTFTLDITFKSNGDANIGTGFSILIRRMFTVAGLQPDVNSYTGSTLLFDIKNAAFRAGQVGNGVFGKNSTGMGAYTVASGDGSVALGRSTIATSFGSVAMGDRTRATLNGATAMGTLTVAGGSHSTAMGAYSIASGAYSTAMGNNSIASGSVAIAMGEYITANADNSIAMGSFVSTNNHEGSLIIGDRSTNNVLNIATPNSFRARFDGGYRFFTSAAATNAESCQLPAGGNAWLTASDYRFKEKFAPVNGENFLKKIAGMQLGSWNYISQNPNKQRHYGPMAQDFYAAFGKDEYGIIGNDTTINTADFDGVNLIAIQALEKRTAKMQQTAAAENKKLTEELAATKILLLQLQKEMEALKAKYKN